MQKKFNKIEFTIVKKIHDSIGFFLLDSLPKRELTVLSNLSDPSKMLLKYKFLK